MGVGERKLAFITLKELKRKPIISKYFIKVLNHSRPRLSISSNNYLNFLNFKTVIGVKNMLKYLHHLNVACRKLSMILLMTVSSTVNKTTLEIEGNAKFQLDGTFTIDGHGKFQLEISVNK